MRLRGTSTSRTVTLTCWSGLDHRIGIAHKTIRELIERDETILMHPEVNKCAKSCHIGHHTWKYPMVCHTL